MPETESPGPRSDETPDVTDVAFVAEGTALALAVSLAVAAATVHRLRRGRWKVLAAISGAEYGRAATGEGTTPRPIKLRQYNPGRMSTLGFVTVVLSNGIRATVYYSVGLWVQVSLGVGWALIVAHTASDNTGGDAFLASLYKEYAVGFRTLTAFILGGYVSEILKRWWASRLLVAQLIGNANSLAMFAFAFIRPPLTGRLPVDEIKPEVTKAAQETVCRYTVLAVELFHLQGRKARPQEVHPITQAFRAVTCGSCAQEGPSLELNDKLDELVERKRCTEDERELLGGITSNHYQVVLSWVLALLSDAADRGMIAPEQLIAAQTSTEKMRQASADLMVYVFLTFTDMAYNILTGLIRGSGPEHWTVIGGFVVFMVAVASFFEGLLRLHELLANPLDDHLCSLNVEDMIEGLQCTSKQTACQVRRPKATALPARACGLDPTLTLAARP